MKSNGLVCLFLLLWAGCASGPSKPKLLFQEGENSARLVSPEGKELLRYQTKKPMGSALATESACYFHPFTTPAGVVVTDVAPQDHRHHRGIFFAWLEVHGAKTADFWGWGEYAPTTGREIVNRHVGPLGPNGLTIHNSWVADGVAMIEETLEARITNGTNANILDLTYTLTPQSDLKLTRWAFGGFCVRCPKHPITVSSADGGTFPAPNHMKPETDWPDQAWYAYTFDLPNQNKAGVAVFNHPKNPATLWHNVTSIAMINPSIVAPAEVQLEAERPLTLRYRVVAFDGPAQPALLNDLEAEFAAH